MSWVNDIAQEKERQCDSEQRKDECPTQENEFSSSLICGSILHSYCTAVGVGATMDANRKWTRW